MPIMVRYSAIWPMFLSFVRPERISSPITRRPAVMMSWFMPVPNYPRTRLPGVPDRSREEEEQLEVSSIFPPGKGFAASECIRGSAEAFEHVIHMGAQELAVAAFLEKRLHVDVPAPDTVLHDDERGP